MAIVSLTTADPVSTSATRISTAGNLGLAEPRSLLDFAIVGAEKSGTTFVHACLQEHPSIFMPDGEIPFFEDPDFSATPLTEFKGLFRDAASTQLRGIRRSNYLALSHTARRIKELAPDVRLVVILRNPIDRAVSAYFHNIKHGFLPCLPIEQGMAALITNRLDDPSGRAPEVLEFGFYASQLRSYLEVFDRNQLLVLTYDELVSRPRATIRHIYEFLSVDPDYVPNNIGRSFNVGTYSVLRLRLFRLGNRFRYTYNESRTRLSRKRQTLADRLVCLSVEAVARVLLLATKKRRPTLSVELARVMHRLYRDDVRALHTLGVLDSIPWPEFAQDLSSSLDAQDSTEVVLRLSAASGT